MFIHQICRRCDWCRREGPFESRRGLLSSVCIDLREALYMARSITASSVKLVHVPAKIEALRLLSSLIRASLLQHGRATRGINEWRGGTRRARFESKARL